MNDDCLRVKVTIAGLFFLFFFLLFVLGPLASHSCIKYTRPEKMLPGLVNVIFGTGYFYFTTTFLFPMI